MASKTTTKHYILYVFAILFILAASYIFTFMLWRPFNGVITEGRPVMKYLCEMQQECHIGVGNYRCSYKGQLRDSSVSNLKQYPKYHGCNESTEGYGISGDFGYIKVESCGCGGLM
jgi:hypothetical protein